MYMVYHFIILYGEHVKRYTETYFYRVYRLRITGGRKFSPRVKLFLTRSRDKFVHRPSYSLPQLYYYIIIYISLLLPRTLDL